MRVNAFVCMCARGHREMLASDTGIGSALFPDDTGRGEGGAKSVSVVLFEVTNIFCGVYYSFPGVCKGFVLLMLCSSSMVACWLSGIGFWGTTSVHCGSYTFVAS